MNETPGRSARWGDRVRALRRPALPGRAQLREAAARHRAFLALLLLGLVLRVVTGLAYRPAIFGVTDSFWYLEHAENLAPSELRPVGYSFFLRLLPLGWGLEVVTAVQHALGLVVAGLLYATLLRLGVRPWFAALAAAPALLDAYILNIEHHILAETVFHLFLAGACAVLLWRASLTLARAGAAGALLAAAGLTRPVGLVLVLPAVAASAGLAPPGRRALAALALGAAFAAPLATYAAWFESEHGAYALTRQSGRYLYGRVARIADCARFAVPAVERPLCPRETGPRLSDYAVMWGRRSPVRRVDPPPGETADDVAGDFARRVIRNQPLDYAGLVLVDVGRSFAPRKETTDSGYRVAPWQFQDHFPLFAVGRLCPEPESTEPEIRGCAGRAARVERAVETYGGGTPGAVDPLAGGLRTYQRFGYVPGPVLLACLLVAVAALVVPRGRGSGLRAAAFLFAGLALALAFGTAATSSFSWRYQLPDLLLLPPAGTIALTALLRRGREP